MRKSILRLAAILLAVGLLAVTFVASPVSAGGKTYSVDVDGAVDTLFTTAGNNSGSRFHQHDVITTLDLTLVDVDGNPVSSHPNFACSPATQTLDDAAWDFHGMNIQKGRVGIRFDLDVECDDGFESYVLSINLLDPDEKNGPGEYDSDEARIVVEHYAERDNPDHPPGPGPSRFSHEDCCATPFVDTTGSVTITISVP